MKAGIWWGTVLGISLGVPLLRAQRAVPPPAPASQAASSRPQAGKAPAPASSSTDRGKRRDPFRTTIVPKKPDEAAQTPINLPPGTKGLVIGQLQLQGVVRGIDGQWIAVVDNKTKRAYFLREKDEVYNGVVSKITADSIVLEENSTDSNGKKSTREVVRRLSGP